MRPSAIGLALIALAPPALAGCSGGEGDDGPALAGTWEVQSGRTRIHATVTTAQNAQSPFAPHTGGVALTGDVTAALRYYAGEFPAGVGYVADAPIPGDEATMAVRLGPSGPADVDFVLIGSDGGRVLQLVAYDGAVPVTRTPTYVELHTAVFRDPDDPTFEVTADGRLTFELIPLAAGAEGEVGARGYTRAEAGVLTRVFGAGGAYRHVAADLSEATGTWSDVGERVRVRIGAETTEYRYGISGSTLTLTDEAGSLCGGGAACPGLVPSYFGIDAGTLEGFRYEDTETLTRGADASPSAGRERPPAPSAARRSGLPAWLAAEPR